ncbi:GNAT family N-acetyltransferase [Pseudonocardia kunmingensis]|uniref:Acetyltransferase (GNAT) family protein n=1 Tax=Pseudonocardia kunmingensis TaxID=630975 RepID=A0A543DZN4_9PSEU|nr:GNAT family N-acetyltransferase [Pseudonocardia kunmingensis]TQM14785.1 acetyltransferase (GNAT) family protein [Pseudonocardia kunmingensis]
MITRPARHEDLSGYLQLAAQVEHWFGPMVENEGFRAAVMRSIRRGSALVVDGEQEAGLRGGLLFGGRFPTFHVHWLVVAEHGRLQGVGRALIVDAISRFVHEPRAAVEVITFAEEHPAAWISGARAFYERLGFVAAEPAGAGPEGGPRQVYRLELGGRSA